MTSESAKPDAKREWPLTALLFAAMTIGLLAVLANLLNYHHYPVAKPEIVLVIAVLLLIAAGVAGVHRLAQPRLGFVFTGLFLALLVDLGIDLGRFPVVSVAALIALLAWRWERIVLKLTAAAFASVLLFQSVDLATADGQQRPPLNEAKRLQAKSSNGETLPPIIHLVLDSYIGFDGMSAADTNFGDLRRQQEQFYLSRGFQIYPQAYSRHAKTVNSLPEFLSYGKAPRATEPRNVQFTVAAPLAYFGDLDRKGYRTSVQAPSFVDFCPNQPLTRCYNYNRSDLSTLASADLAVADRARVIGFTLIELSPFLANQFAHADIYVGERFGSRGRRSFNRAKLYSLSGFAQLDAFTRDLATLRHGDARFIHLLLPHDPYMLDDRCKLLPEPGWIDEHGPAKFAERDAAYARQTRCMTDRNLGAMMAALDKTAAGRAAIVIIQGDHGSRTVNGVPGADEGKHSARAMTVTHSAFFAIRMPGQPAAQVSGQFALDELIGGFAATGFTAAPRPATRSAEVYLMDSNWIPAQRVALPPFVQKLPKN